MVKFKYIHPLSTLILSLSFGLTTSSVFANEDLETTSSSMQSIMIPLAHKDRTSNINLPVRGEDKSMVEQEFGQPIKSHPAKGKPPISRWDYPEFSVYFESDKVIHCVVKTKTTMTSE